MPVGWAIVIITLWVAVVVLAVIVLGTLRQVIPHLQQVASGAGQGQSAKSLGPPPGRPLPDFTARAQDGGDFGPADLRGQGGVLVFMSAGCGPCQDLAGELKTSDLTTLASQLIVVTVPGSVSELGLPDGLRVVTETGRQVSDPLNVRALPYAIAVDKNGIVRAKRLVNKLDGLFTLALAATPADQLDLQAVNGSGHHDHARP